MCIINMGKLIKSKEPVFLHEILKLNIEPSPKSNHIFVPKFNRNHYQNSFCYQAPKLWNMLTSSKSYCGNVTGAPTLSSMKSRLKMFLIKMQNYGNPTEWINANKIISNYLRSIKSDPYFDNK